jgi:hypothetical protein
MTRYFCCTPATYTAICAQLDAAYGYPRPETLTERTLPAVETLPTDEQDRVYLAVAAAYCDYVLSPNGGAMLLVSDPTQARTRIV